MMKRKHKRAVATAVWAVFGLLTAWLLATVGLGVYFARASDCGGCHVMKPYRRALADGPHSKLPCRACHVTPGVAGTASIGFSGERRALSAVLGRTPSQYSPVSDASCRRCHVESLARTVESHGIRVRHREFTAIRCSQCHAGSAHQLADRTYPTSHMDECVSCHTPRASDPATCQLCHIENVQRDTRGATAWRAVHGPNWERTHGMGRLTTCATCHESGTCERCHGTKIPHDPDWLQTHGPQATDARNKVKCVRCHESDWCTDCHGVTMPHAAGFIKQHASSAEKLGVEACRRCHSAEACDDCHMRSRHPQGPDDANSPHTPSTEAGE